MDWEQLFQRWNAEGEATKPPLWEASPLWHALTKEARTALGKTPVPNVEWLLAALEGTAEEGYRRRKLITCALFDDKSRAPEVLFDAMLRAGIYERDPSFNKGYLLPCLRLAGPRRVNEALVKYLENGTNDEKAGVASAFYWTLRNGGHRGIPREDIDDLKAMVRNWFLREYVENSNLRIRQHILPHVTLNPELYPEELRPLIQQVIQISLNHEDEFIRNRIALKLNGGGLIAPIPD